MLAAMNDHELGLSDEQVHATVQSDAAAPVWSPRQALVIRLVDELHESSAISDPLWTQLSAEWDEASLVELLVVVGFYHAISFVVNGARVQREDWAARFP